MPIYIITPTNTYNSSKSRSDYSRALSCSTRTLYILAYWLVFLVIVLKSSGVKNRLK
jgi:hypothetical protein